MTKIETPECDKMLSVKEESQKIGCFLEWLQEKEYTLCIWNQGRGRGEYHPARKSIEELLADYFEIDLKKAEKEKQSILDSIRGNDKEEYTAEDYEEYPVSNFSSDS